MIEFNDNQFSQFGSISNRYGDSSLADSSKSLGNDLSGTQFPEGDISSFQVFRDDLYPSSMESSQSDMSGTQLSRDDLHGSQYMYSSPYLAPYLLPQENPTIMKLFEINPSPYKIIDTYPLIQFSPESRSQVV